LTLGVFAVGRFVDRLVDLRLKTDAGDATPELEQVSGLMRGVAHVMPDLSLYNTTTYVVYDRTIEWGYVAQATAYGLTYMAICLVIASFFFSRRDFV
jgi:hypothetical protein